MSERQRPRQTTAQPAGPGPEAPAPITSVMRGAAAASPSYSAATAKGAATALVRMLMEQGVFGYDAPAAPAGPDDAGAEATAWTRVRSAVSRAEADREADLPVLSSALVMGEILHEMARSRAVPR
ncbi:hypothetical protein LG634_12615 [Streptomyces bambusae]|uniref:hypothetical protein n=1 Tax=Streptomyces bambusae TaxID=1550616 RepID=UPI001CFF283F|nr:hypothetical protein [Streptomyces bambusae]MCB5165674.1 hypothetical protein [Streptomyces bambusae]